jgi:hypothetical protein
MDGHDSIMGSDTEAHSGSTPQPPVSNNANMGPPKRKNRSNRSACWDHFTPMPRVEGVKACWDHFTPMLGSFYTNAKNANIVL